MNANTSTLAGATTPEENAAIKPAEETSAAASSLEAELGILMPCFLAKATHSCFVKIDSTPSETSVRKPDVRKTRSGVAKSPISG